MTRSKNKHVAVIGAGPAGLMAADVLSAAGIAVDIYEAKPSVGRKFLMAGKGGLNITHAEPMADFIRRYDQPEWLAPMLAEFGAEEIRQWMTRLSVASFVGSSGRVFPAEMKAAPLLRNWLGQLKKRGVNVHCRQYWQGFTADGDLQFEGHVVAADAVILALGGGSWASLGADGLWMKILAAKNIALSPLQPSNGGFTVNWSKFMCDYAGQPLKNIRGSVEQNISQAEAIITEYGIEGGLIYALSRPLREQILECGRATLHLDLLPDVTEAELAERLQASPKESLSNVWRKARLAGVKAALVREILPKNQWADGTAVAACVKHCPIALTGMQPIDEAISTSGGVMREAVDERLMLRELPGVFCCGEMLDWDAPTGGYLLTACFASGRFAAHGVLNFLA